MQPLTANQFFTVHDGFTGRYARKRENVGVLGFIHKPWNP